MEKEDLNLKVGDDTVYKIYIYDEDGYGSYTFFSSYSTALARYNDIKQKGGFNKLSLCAEVTIDEVYNGYDN